MRRRLLILCLLAVASPAAADEFSPFLDLGGLPHGDLGAAAEILRETLANTEGLDYLGSAPFAGPDLVRGNPEQRDGRRGLLLMLEDRALSAILLAIDPRYYLGALLRVGLYQTTDGTLRITCLDPETHLRVIANDLKCDETYAELAAAGAAARERLAGAVRKGLSLTEALVPVGPIRDVKRMREGKMDMFLMVGPLTYYRKESQFPVLHAEPLGEDPVAQLRVLADRITSSLAAFSAGADELNYCWSMDPAADTSWRELTRQEAPGKAILLGLSRPRAEALAAQIVGRNRDNGQDRSPGLDHLCAFPIEVLICVNDDRVELRTARQMFRMDLFFWDAGKEALMKYAQIPAMLDKSLKKALLGK
ncbi:hypothetical protein H8E07_21170 [bacterium]|nr:hypothetical protein [bacterium]